MNIKKYYKTYRVLPPDYFYIENAGDGENTLSFYTTGSGNLGSMKIEYSFDCINWTLLAFTLTKTPIEIKHNEKIYFRSTADTWAEYAYSLYGKINTTNNIKVGGNILSLIWSDKFEDKTSLKRTYSFYSFFSAIGPKLLSAKNLKLYGSTEGAYKNMFSGCTSLVDAPAIISISSKAAKNQYQSMFQGCTSLISAPEILPATTLATNCYQYMFQGCTSLISAPVLPATTLAESCYSNMFKGCSKLTTAPEILPATTLATTCYSYMFEGCTSLTTAPVLPATTLTAGCYYQMFYNCQNLKYIKADFLDAPTGNQTTNWVYKVSSSGTFVKNPAATWENTFGTSAIPTGWTVVTE